MFSNHIPSYVGHLPYVPMQLGLAVAAQGHESMAAPVDARRAFSEMLGHITPGSVWHAQFARLRFDHSLISAPRIKSEWSGDAGSRYEALSLNARAGVYYLRSQGVSRDVIGRFLSHHVFTTHPERCDFILGMVSRLEALGVVGIARLFQPEAGNPLMLEAIAQCPVQCIAQTMIQALCLSTYGVGVESVEVRPALSANWKAADFAVKSFAESMMAHHEADLTPGYFSKTNIPVTSNFTVKNKDGTKRAVYVMTSQEAYAPEAHDERRQILKIMEIALAASQQKMSGVECVIVAPGVDSDFLSKINYVLNLFNQPYLIRIENDDPKIISAGLDYEVARECCFIPSPSFPLPKVASAAAEQSKTINTRRTELEAQPAKGFALTEVIKSHLKKITGFRSIAGTNSSSFADECQALGAEHREELVLRLNDVVGSVDSSNLKTHLDEVVRRFSGRRSTERMTFDAIKDLLIIATLMAEYGQSSNSGRPSTQQQATRIEDYLKENKGHIESYVRDWLPTASENLELSMIYNSDDQASTKEFYGALVALSQSDPEVPCYDGFQEAVWSMRKIHQLMEHFMSVSWDENLKAELGHFIDAHHRQSARVRSRIQEETKSKITTHYQAVDISTLPTPDWGLHDAPGKVTIKTVFPFGIISTAARAESYSDSVATSSWEASQYLDIRDRVQELFDEASQERASGEFDDIAEDCRTGLPVGLKSAALVDPSKTRSLVVDDLEYEFEVDPKQVWVINAGALDKAVLEIEEDNAEEYINEGLKDVWLDALPYDQFMKLSRDERKRRFPKAFYLIDQIKSGQLRAHS